MGRKYSALHVWKILRIEEMVTLCWIRLLHWITLKRLIVPGVYAYLLYLAMTARTERMIDNLVDSGVDGGRLEDITLGLNWFLNPNMKIQSNYAYTMRDAQASPGGGDYYGYGMRLAWDF